MRDVRGTPCLLQRDLSSWKKHRGDPPGCMPLVVDLARSRGAAHGVSGCDATPDGVSGGGRVGRRDPDGGGPWECRE